MKKNQECNFSENRNYSVRNNINSIYYELINPSNFIVCYVFYFFLC